MVVSVVGRRDASRLPEHLAIIAPVETDLPQARSLSPLIVRALEQLGGEAPRGEIIETALRLGDFTADQRAVPSRHTRANAQQPSELHHRLGWAISHAKNAGEVESVRLGVWRLVDP
jgi:hypothetical protein